MADGPTRDDVTIVENVFGAKLMPPKLPSWLRELWEPIVSNELVVDELC